MEWIKLTTKERELSVRVGATATGGAILEMEFPGREILGELCGLFWLLGMNDWRAGKALSYIHKESSANGE